MSRKHRSGPMAVIMVAVLGVTLAACGETEAELREARHRRCTAEGIANQVLLDQCLQSQKKMCRQVYWHHQKSFTDEERRRGVETYGRVMGDLADRCRKFIKLD